MYSIKQVAKALNVHPRTIKKWIKAGKIKAYGFGEQTIRIDVEELERFKRESTIDNRAAADGSTAKGSEKSLAKDWLKPEEEEAWKDL